MDSFQLCPLKCLSLHVLFLVFILAAGAAVFFVACLFIITNSAETRNAVASANHFYCANGMLIVSNVREHSKPFGGLSNWVVVNYRTRVKFIHPDDWSWSIVCHFEKIFCAGV